jgi:predicted nucleic acid-binding protein
VKGLDTPILLDLLRGRKSAARLVEELHGEELATTEINLFELEVIARSGPRKGLEKRLAALDGLRRKLTVLPVEEKGCRAAAARGPAATSGGIGAPQALMLGVAEAAGCSEWLTIRAARAGAGRGKLRVRVLPS